MSYIADDPTSCPYCLHACGRPHLEQRSILVAWRDGLDAVVVPWANGEAPRLPVNAYPDGTIEAWAWWRGWQEGCSQRAGTPERR